jgi:hypothetical protein
MIDRVLPTTQTAHAWQTPLERLTLARQAYQTRTAGWELGPATPGPVRMVVQSIEVNHLVCRTWNGQQEGDYDVIVAKPFSLRHAADHYERLDVLTTVLPQKMQVEYTPPGPGGGTKIEETWTVTPGYFEGAEIWAVFVPTGLTVVVDDVEVEAVWLDQNVCGRAWAVEE